MFKRPSPNSLRLSLEQGHGKGGAVHLVRCWALLVVCPLCPHVFARSPSGQQVQAATDPWQVWAGRQDGARFCANSLHMGPSTFPSLPRRRLPIRLPLLFFDQTVVRGGGGCGALQALIWSRKSTGLPIEIRTAHVTHAEDPPPEKLSYCKLDIDIHKVRKILFTRTISPSSLSLFPFFLSLPLSSCFGSFLYCFRFRSSLVSLPTPLFCSLWRIHHPHSFLSTNRSQFQ